MANCKKCGAELVPGAKFCMECGNQIPQVSCCVCCGAELVPNAKFCLECGTPVVKYQTNGINMGDANAISAQNVIGGNQEVVHGNKEVINGNKITAGNYTINNVTNEAGYAQDSVNVEQLMEKAKDYYEDENYFKALSIFREIADRDIEAVYYLGLCTRDGDGTKQDYRKAAELLEKAASAGLPDAQCELAFMCVDSRYGMKNVLQAVKWFTKAADNGNQSALENLGLIYLCGYGVQKDERLAYDLLLQAYKRDESYLLNCALGNIFYEGKVVQRDISKAVKYYRENEGEYVDRSDWCCYDNEVDCNSLLNYADILINNIDGYGDYELGVDFLQFAVEQFESKCAKEIIQQLSKDEKIRIYKDNKGKYAMTSDGVMFNEDLSVLIGVNEKFWDARTQEYVVPNSVKNIGNEAFLGLDGLRKIVLPMGLQKIGNSAFEYCSSLKNINIPNSVTSIGEYAFHNCFNLSSAISLINILEIGDFAFSGCTSLDSVIIGSLVKYIGNDPFSSCDNLKTIIYQDTKTQWEKIKKHWQWKDNPPEILVHCTDGVIKLR